MPIYEYRCGQCGHQGSDIDSFSAPRVKKCPQCGRRAFSRLISAAAFHLKGGGWYATDFKDKPKAKGGADDKPVADKDGKKNGGKNEESGGKESVEKSVEKKDSAKDGKKAAKVGKKPSARK